jgi:hypothetical protein
MRNNSRRKNQPGFLRCRIYRSQQASASKPRTPRFGVNHDVSHFQEINHQAAIACAKAGKAVSAAADSSEQSNFGSGANSILNIGYIGAPCDQAGRVIEHAIPDTARGFIIAMAGAQQITFELPMKRRVNLFTGCEHINALPGKYLLRCAAGFARTRA